MSLNSRISNEEFKVEVPTLNPLSPQYVSFWREQRKRSIDGYWSSGKYMPGKLYFYVNFGTIKKKGLGRSPYFGKPDLRDLEWEFFLNWTEARGFSSFEKDDQYTCLKIVKDLKDFEIVEIPDVIYNDYPEALNNQGELKTYIEPREYLRKIHSENLGSPLFKNQSQNMMMLGSRGFGKSYSCGVGIVAHEFLFDGMLQYDPATAKTKTAQIVVGAAESRYSTETLDKTRLALEQLPGSVDFNDTRYPAPFFKRYVGSFGSGSKILSRYKKKIGSKWSEVGSQSSIHNVSFKDNPFAANGMRNNVMLWEEIGFFPNFKPSYAASVETQRDGSWKFGSMMFIGTGGDMVGGGTLDAQEVFYNPEAYDCIGFPDLYEFRPSPIGYFVGAFMGLNQFKDKEGNTNIEAATAYLQAEREKLKRTKNAQASLEAEIVNRPIVPSEMFLSSGGNIFPVTDIRGRLEIIESTDMLHMVEKKVKLFFNPEAKEFNGVDYVIDGENELTAINKFPWREHNREGTVVIYDFPAVIDGRVPKGAYIIGHDPYAVDDPDGNSLGVIFVLKTNKYPFEIGQSELVATYKGRPYQGRHVVNDILHKLSLMYGEAKIYFENVRGNVKEYFEKIKRLDLLAKQPQTVFNKKASYASGPSQVYGYPMSSRSMKMEGVQYIRDWLLEPRGETSIGTTLRNIDYIWDRALLQEMLSFSLDGNFDSVMSFMGCIVGLNETHNQYEKEFLSQKKQDEVSSFLGNNKKLFPSSPDIFTQIR